MNRWPVFRGWRWGALILCAVVVAAGLLGYQAWRSDHAATRWLSVTGTIEATEVDVTAKYSGRITTLHVKEGMAVKRGERLATLDDEELKAEVARLDAALRQARAQLQDLLAGARGEELEEARASAERARAQLDDLVAGARPEELAQARSSLKAATATREWTEADLRRAEELLAKGLIAAADRDRATQAHAVAPRP